MQSFILFEIALKKLSRPFFFRVREEVFWLAFFSNDALIHKDDTVRDIAGELHFVGYDNHGYQQVTLLELIKIPI